MITYNEWNIKEETGYEPITTLYMDFGIAERFGERAIIDTFARVLKEYSANDNSRYKELTELVMVLNWKIWEHYGHNETVQLI